MERLYSVTLQGRQTHNSYHMWICKFKGPKNEMREIVKNLFFLAVQIKNKSSNQLHLFLFIALKNRNHRFIHTIKKNWVMLKKTCFSVSIWLFLWDGLKIHTCYPTKKKILLPRMKTSNSRHHIQTSASKLSFLQLMLSTHYLWQQHKVPQIHTTHFHTVGQRRTETREE